MQRQSDSGLEEVTKIVSRFISETDYDRLPPPITDRIKKSILDTLGIILPASVLMPDLKSAIDLVIEAGGKRKAPFWPTGSSCPAGRRPSPTGSGPMRWIMRTVTSRAVFRIGVSVIPAALALAERKAGSAARS